jgi:hypothetical protein
MEHSEIIAWAIEGGNQPNSAPTDRSHRRTGRLKSAVFCVRRQQPTKVEPTTLAAQRLYSAHIPIWYSIFPLDQ